MGNYDADVPYAMPGRRSDNPEAIYADRDSKEARDMEARSSTRIGPQLAFMQDQINKTHALISELSMRIEAVLMPEEETRDDGMVTTVVPKDRGSELSMTIDDLNAQLSRMQKRLIDIRERVQL